MVLYPYISMLAVDGETLEGAPNAVGQVYAEGDTAFATPLPTVDANGLPVVLKANARSILPSFYVDGHAGVVWKSGDWELPLVSSKPLKGDKGDKGDPGQDGSNVIPTAEAIATEIETPGTQARATLDATYANKSMRGLDVFETQRWTTLRPFAAALANRHYKRLDIGVLGDSITEGQGATQFTRRWVARLQDQLRSRFPTTGLTGGGAGFIASGMSGQTSYTSPASFNSGVTPSNPYGPKRHSMVLNAAGEEITFTVTGTSCDLLYIGGTGGAVSYTVDGGTATQFTIPGPLLDGQKRRITFGSAGAHTVKVTWVSGSSYIHGIIGYNGDEDKGIHVNDAGHYGWNTGTGSAGWMNGNFGAQYWPAGVASVATDLLIIALGTNDPAAGITPAVHKTNLQALITKVREGYGQLGVTPPPIVLAPYGGPSAASSTWAQYVDAEYEVAAADPAVIVADLSLRLPNAASNTLGLYADGVGHPTDKGHALIGDAMATFLLPR